MRPFEQAETEALVLKNERYFFEKMGLPAPKKKKEPAPLPSQEELRKVFDYDPDTGELRWKISKPRVKAGMRAGCKPKKTTINESSRVVCYKREHYLEHKIIWRWLWGETSLNPLHHLDGDKSNNRLSNLFLKHDFWMASHRLKKRELVFEFLKSLPRKGPRLLDDKGEVI